MHHRLIRACLVTLTLFCVLPLVAFAGEAPKGGTAFLKSLVIPGWGQYELGYKNTALAFIGTELALVGGMLALEDYGRSTRGDYQAMATAYAGVNGAHGHAFYVDVGNWMNVDQFNERRLGERAFDALYTSPEDQWAWDSEAHRALMEKTRIRSDRAFNSILYLAGGLLLNHVASAIHAGRLAVKQQQGQHASALSAKGWAMDVKPLVRAKGLQLRFTHAF
jgi:hypothetical protein